MGAVMETLMGALMGNPYGSLLHESLDCLVGVLDFFWGLRHWGLRIFSGASALQSRHVLQSSMAQRMTWDKGILLKVLGGSIKGS